MRCLQQAQEGCVVDRTISELTAHIAASLDRAVNGGLFGGAERSRRRGGSGRLHDKSPVTDNDRPLTIGQSVCVWPRLLTWFHAGSHLPGSRPVASCSPVHLAALGTSRVCNAFSNLSARAIRAARARATPCPYHATVGTGGTQSLNAYCNHGYQRGTCQHSAAIKCEAPAQIAGQGVWAAHVDPSFIRDVVVVNPWPR